MPIKPYIPASIEPFVDAYRRDRRVLGVLLAGSVVQGTADQFSDVDLYFLTRGRFQFTRRLRFGKSGLLDCISDSFPDAKAILQRERGRAHRPFAHYLAHGRILWERDGKMSAVQRQAKSILQSRTTLTKTERVMHQYSLDDFLTEMKRDIMHRDDVSFCFYRQLFVDNAIDFLAKIYRCSLPPPRLVLPHLIKCDPQSAKLIRVILVGRTMQQQLNAANRLFHHVNQLVGGPLHGDIKIRLSAF